MPARAGFTITTNQGNTITVRPLHYNDTNLLINLFEHLSPESRYQRFHRWLEHPEPERVQRGAEQLAHLSPEQGLAWIGFAVVDGAAAPVAVARYVRLNETQAEPALTVRDDFQGQGIGKQLFRHLIAAAQAEHLHQFVAMIQPSNHAAVQLVQNTGYSFTKEFDEGQIVLTIELTPHRSNKNSRVTLIRNLPPVTA